MSASQILTPGARAAESPDRVAQVMAASGESLTYAEFESLSARIAAFIQSRGLGLGDHVSLLTGNDLESLSISWAAQRSGVYWTPLNTRWTADELEHVINDSGTRLVLVTRSMLALADSLVERKRTDAEFWGIDCSSAAVSRADLPDSVDGSLVEFEGRDMLYSSGTTGKPKGVKPGPVGLMIGTPDPTTLAIHQNYAVGADSVFLAATPLFHVAALASALVSIRYGGVVVVLEKFTADGFLKAIADYGVTHTMTVPTILSRVLDLPDDTKNAHDLSTLTFLGHGGAPCPPSVKERSIEFFGPVVYDSWGATERPGLTLISSQEWLRKRGSVGRPISGIPHIMSDRDVELPAGEIGQIYWESAQAFEYHHDIEKTLASRNGRGWATVGDIGYVDEEGYLFLTDRASHMIITGGENVYPAEIEGLLVELDFVRDVAVIGRPHRDFGQQVVAFIELADGVVPTDDLVDQVLAFAHGRLAGYKCPREVEFISEMPRNATGKLMKRELS